MISQRTRCCCINRADGVVGGSTVGDFVLIQSLDAYPALQADRRHPIPKQKGKVTNSAAYDAALRQRGSLTIWFTDEAIEGWRAGPRTSPGVQSWYSGLM